jgi:NAD+ diphosphatase
VRRSVEVAQTTRRRTIPAMQSHEFFAAFSRFESMIEPPMEAEGRQSFWFFVGQGTILTHVEGDSRRIPLLRDPQELGLQVDHQHFLGMADGTPVWAAGLDRPASVPDELKHEQLMALFSHLPDQAWTLAGRAVQIAEWHRTHQYCGRCSERTDAVRGERARRCPACGLLSFPRLSPAVITVVTDGPRILLARGRTFGRPMYSALAGFVEPGESLEECVAREVKEEVGVDVKNVRYYKSQPWPFPNSLMLGFFADYVGGEINCQESEIVDAQWYTPDNLPDMPGRMSIARWLIDEWLETQK